MNLRPDNRLATAPMVPVACRNCGAQVLARKSSWEQTTVQWNAAATRSCPQWQEAAALPAAAGRAVFLSCSELTASILDAVEAGAMPIVDEMAVSD